jgi:hypothetical protein
LIQGIAAKPELNGQVGLVISYDGGADRRYSVKVLGTIVRLKEEKLSIVPEGYVAPAAEPPAGSGSFDTVALCPTNSGDEVDTAIQGLSSMVAHHGSGTPVSNVVANDQAMEEARQRDAATAETISRMPQGEVSKSGQLVPTYDWVQVPAIASLPPGMEVWMPVGGLKCARIPSTWRLQVVAEGQVDSYRCDVGEGTPVIQVITGAAAAFGWEVHKLELHGEGSPIELQDEATVGSAGLFGRKLTARNQAA